AAHATNEVKSFIFASSIRLLDATLARSIVSAMRRASIGVAVAVRNTPRQALEERRPQILKRPPPCPYAADAARPGLALPSRVDRLAAGAGARSALVVGDARGDRAVGDHRAARAGHAACHGPRPAASRR